MDLQKLSETLERVFSSRVLYTDCMCKVQLYLHNRGNSRFVFYISSNGEIKVKFDNYTHYTDADTSIGREDLEKALRFMNQIEEVIASL